jgi:hypothetical protein
VTSWLDATAAERSQALSPRQALWELDDLLHGDSRDRLCDIYGQIETDYGPITSLSTEVLAREVGRRIESGSLLVIRIPEPSFHAPPPALAVVEEPKPAPAPVKDPPVTVKIKASDGVSDPPVAIAASGRVSLKGVPSAGSGSYQWSTKSKLITLESPTAETVVVVAGATLSSGAPAETISLIFTPSGKAALPAVTHVVGVSKATFAAEASHPWGYDAYGPIKYRDKDGTTSEPKPGPAEDFVSVKIGGVGKVKLDIAGARPADIFLKSANPSVCKPKILHPSAASSVIELEGAAAGEADIEAHLGSEGGPLVARVGSVVRKEAVFKAELFYIVDSKTATTALTTKPTAEQVRAALDDYYKQAVGRWELAGGSEVDVTYDLNKNGKLDMEPGAETAEQQAIIAKCRPKSGYQAVVVVKQLRWCYYLDKDAGADDTEIWIKKYGGSLAFLGKLPYTFADDAGHSLQATIKSVDTATGKVTLTAKLGTALKTADKAALIFPLGGLAAKPGKPLWIGEKSNVATLGNYVGHELGHTLASWSDVCERNNLMYGGPETGQHLRHRPVTKYYDLAANDEQWKGMTRP